jgi:ATP-binding protein involved in chromosome partitioning
VIAVTSGPQRAGQTAVAVNVAAELASRGARVGVLDADVDGPSVRSALDVTDDVDVGEEGTLVPVERDGLKVASVTDVLGADPPHVERTGLGERLLAGLVHDVEWQPLDYLFVVAPPTGPTTDRRLLDSIPVTGAVVVTSMDTSPAGDESRCVDALVDRDVPVLGVAENAPSLAWAGYRPGWGRRPSERVDSVGVPRLGPVSVDAADGVVVGDGNEPAAAVAALGDAVTNEVGVLHRLTACANATGTAAPADSAAGCEWQVQASACGDETTDHVLACHPTGEYIKRCKLVHS